MFTINQIKDAHSKVKTGADFPNFVRDLIKLNVSRYETYVADGHTSYFGKNNFNIQSAAKYPALAIADKSEKIRFTEGLKAHQQGQTDFPAFCRLSAESGVEKWVVDMTAMTCTYYDKAGGEILVEAIPVNKESP